MSIATKNGSLIVKNGSLAENCGCCGGWYCCPDTKCLGDFVSSVSVSLQGQDRLELWTLRESQPFPTPYSQWPVLSYDTYGILASLVTGSVTLTKQSRSVVASAVDGHWTRYETVYSYAFPAHTGGCADTVTLKITDGGYRGDLSSGTFGEIGISAWVLTLSCNVLWSRSASQGGFASVESLACGSGRVASRTWSGSFDPCSFGISVDAPQYSQASGYSGGLPQRVFFEGNNYSLSVLEEKNANPAYVYYLDDEVIAPVYLNSVVLNAA